MAVKAVAVVKLEPQNDFTFRYLLQIFALDGYREVNNDHYFQPSDSEVVVKTELHRFVVAYILAEWGITLGVDDTVRIFNSYQEISPVVALSNKFSAFWNLIEDTGTPRAGSVGPDLTEVGTVTREATPDGSWEAAFDTGSYLTIENSPDLVSGDFDFAVSFWLRYAAIGGDRPIFSSWSTANTRMVFELWWQEAGGVLELRVHNGTTVDVYPTSFLVDGSGLVRTFIVLWYEAATNTIHVKVNALSVQSFVLTAPMLSDSDRLDIGMSQSEVAGANGLYGFIRRFGYGRFNPTAAELAILFDSARGQDWPMEEPALLPVPSGTGYALITDGVQATTAAGIQASGMGAQSIDWTSHIMHVAGDRVMGHLGGSTGPWLALTGAQVASILNLSAMLDTLTTAATDGKIPIRVAGVWVGMTLSDVINQSGISTADGDMLFRGASGIWTRLPKGTAGQTLRMNAGATAPEWQ